MTSSNKVVLILRWILGVFFIGSSTLFLFARLGFAVPLPSDGSPAGAAFMTALRESGFVAPLMGLFYYVGGGALLADRTAPLGLVLLGPFVVVIFFYHLVLTGNWPWGSLWFALFLALTWAYRQRLSALWTLPKA